MTAAATTLPELDAAAAQHVQSTTQTNPGQEGPKSGWKMKVALFMLQTAIVGMVGAVAGYYAALSIPAPAQVMVFDLDRAMEGAAAIAIKSGKDPRVVAAEVVAMSRQRIKSFTDMGIVVLDRSAILDAPKELIIGMDEFPGKESVNKKKLTEAEMAEQIGLMQKQLEAMQGNAKR